MAVSLPTQQRFVDMLSQKLEAAGCHVLQAVGDADVLIANTAVARAAESPTTVVGEDTDLLVLLICHADPESHTLYMQSDKKKGKKFRVWDIHWFQRSLRTEMCSLLPFAHAIGGCDTTSHLFGIGKGVPLRQLKNDQNFRKQAYVYSGEATKEEIHHAGEAALPCLYGGQPDEGLDKLRHRKFCEKVSTSIAPVQVHTLPPTSAAAKNHSARVYYQVQEWMGHLALDPQAAMGMDSGRGPTRLHNNELTCCTGVSAKNCSLQLQNRLQLTQTYMQKDGTGAFCSLW